MPIVIQMSATLKMPVLKSTWMMCDYKEPNLSWCELRLPHFSPEPLGDLMHVSLRRQGALV